MKLYFWALAVFHAALGHAETGHVFMSSDKYFGELRNSLGSMDIADAVARTFYLGYLDPKAQTDFLKLPLDPPSENILLTVTGLDGVDLATLPNMQALKASTPLSKENEDPQSSFVSLRKLAESAGARAVGLTDAPVPSYSVETFSNDEFWGPLVKGDLLSRPGMLALVQELELFRKAKLTQSSAETPTFYFGSLRGLDGVAQSDKGEAAKLVDAIVGLTLTSLPGALVEIVAVQDPVLSSRMVKLIRNDVPNQYARRKLLTETTNQPTVSPTSSSGPTLQNVIDAQIRWWIMIILFLTSYTAVYYMAFYGNFEADQMLYTSFNARWDERKGN